ncbi:hypothetical protein [Nocardia macrotermitis]|uniref:Uncharacterized protein n=1 Tax=Nocardia macrotermitis TaxID=2585198 RepID=A0A7K0D841_9NOCA|nr:hypothetical protein [Nocardia macrotermitis]MQY21926.1 hypothetical protein [Nocardia macrotermitis]
MAIDSGLGGVIGAQTADPVAAVSAAASQTAQNIASAVQNGPFAHISLPQWPTQSTDAADATEATSPELHLSQKEFEDGHSSSLGGGHIPGLGDTSTHTSSLTDAASPLLGSANDALTNAQHTLGAIPGAQNVFDNAHTALNSAPSALSSAASSIHQAAAPIAAADPTGTVETLLSKGITLPAIPGIEQLFQPFASLLQSFGTGVMGALDPSTLLSQSSQIIQAAMSVGQGALKSVEQVWQGKSADSAQSAGQQTQSKGEDTSQRGFDISKLTDEAAAVVQKGNVQLTAVAQSFATQATALAPVIVTPPAQATLIATATEHLGTAVSIVNATRGELSGYTGQLSGVVNQLLGQSGAGQQAAQAAQSVAQNIAQPVMEQAQSLLSNNSDSSTSSSDLTSKLGTSTAGFGGSHSGGGGSFSSGGGGGSSLGTNGIGTNSGGGLGSSVPGTIANASNAVAAQVSAAARAAGLTSPSSFMGGGGAAANARNTEDEEHQSTVQPYQSITGDTELSGLLGEIAPDVIGQVHNDEEINGYSSDSKL